MARGRHDYEKKVIAIESEGYKDLHGRVLMNDDFEDAPLKWITFGSGIHSETRQARAAYNGGFGMELDVTSNLPPASREARMYRYVPIDVTQRLHGEIFWRANDISILNTLELWIEYWDGTEYHTAAIRYIQTTTSWEYYTDTVGWNVVPNSTQTFFDEGWNELTLSIDFATNFYIRMKSNNLDLNMGTIPSRHTGNLAGAHASIMLIVRNVTSNQLIVSIDDAVLKELER